MSFLFKINKASNQSNSADANNVHASQKRQQPQEKIISALKYKINNKIGNVFSWKKIIAKQGEQVYFGTIIISKKNIMVIKMKHVNQRYFDKTKRYLKDIINDLQKFVTWKN